MDTGEGTSPEIKLKKNHISIALLIIILLLGFYLRTYHIDYPVVGYHNWKETHYLTEARNFARDGFFRYGFFVPAWNYPNIKSDPSGIHSDTFPSISILAALSFMVFGYELWAARIIGILMTTACIPLIYLIVNEVFSRRDMAIVAAFLTAINPLFVFFSHNVQLINVSVAFMLLSLYSFLLWRRKRNNSFFILSFVFLAIATSTKYSFLITLIPMAFLFPFREISIKGIKKNLTPYIFSAAIMLLIPAWMIYIDNATTTGGKSASFSLIEPWRLTTKEFWNITPSYIADSITWIGFYFAVLGILFLVISSLKRRSAGEIFLWSYLLGFIIFVVIMARKLGQHSYHYYPVIPLVIILIGYALVKIGDIGRNRRIEGKQIKHINILLVAFLLVIIIPSTIEAINRQFNTQFYGLDVAGEYLREHKQPGERLMHSSFQAYGVLWHADMMGTGGIPRTVEDMKFAENNLNATWLFIYNWDFYMIQDKEHKELWNYISSNYRLVQFAFIQNRNQPTTPIYMLLRKGGSFDENKLDEMLKDKPIKHEYYELTPGKIRLDYVNIE